MTVIPFRAQFITVTPAQRRRIEATIHELVAILDLVDGDIDREDGGDHEPDLAWPERGPQACRGGEDDRELEDEHDEDGDAAEESDADEDGGDDEPGTDDEPDLGWTEEKGDWGAVWNGALEADSAAVG